MAKYYYASPKFPFAKVFPLGIVLVIVGVIVMTLGVVDVVYTHLKFVGSSCDPTSYQTWQCPIQPCNSPSLPWAMASPGIWAGIFMLIAGSVSTSLMYSSSTTIKPKRDTTGVMAGLVGFPIGPMALVVCSLRLYYMNGTFFCLNQGSMKVTDYIEFLMPILMVVTSFLGWCLGLAILVALCRKGALSQREELEYDYDKRYHSQGDSELKNPRRSSRRPFIQPSQDRLYPTNWRDRAIGYQDPYMYSRGQPYFYQAQRDRSGDRSYPSYSFPRQTPSRRYYTTETLHNRY